MIMKRRGKTYNERLRLLGITMLEKRRVRSDTAEVFKLMKGFEGIRGDSSFKIRCLKIKGHSIKVYFILHFDTGLDHCLACLNSIALLCI